MVWDPPPIPPLPPAVLSCQNEPWGGGGAVAQTFVVWAAQTRSAFFIVSFAKVSVMSANVRSTLADGNPAAGGRSGCAGLPWAAPGVQGVGPSASAPSGAGPGLERRGGVSGTSLGGLTCS